MPDASPSTELDPSVDESSPGHIEVGSALDFRSGNLSFETLPTSIRRLLDRAIDKVLLPILEQAVYTDEQAEQAAEWLKSAKARFPQADSPMQYSMNGPPAAPHPPVDALHAVLAFLPAHLRDSPKAQEAIGEALRVNALEAFLRRETERAATAQTHKGVAAAGRNDGKAIMDSQASSTRHVQEQKRREQLRQNALDVIMALLLARELEVSERSIHQMMQSLITSVARWVMPSPTLSRRQS